MVSTDAPVCTFSWMSKIRFFYSKTFHWCIIAFGTLVRIAQFLYNRSLTEGEAALALNIINKSYTDLLQPLDHTQAAPVGFLFIQRFMVTLFGNTELAMRTFPLLTGITSLFLFYSIAKRILKPSALSFGLILFAAGDHLIYFASEVKQYSADVCWALCIILIALQLVQHRKKVTPISKLPTFRKAGNLRIDVTFSQTLHLKDVRVAKATHRNKEYWRIMK